jgi:rhodanese-related sulfurtransferase
MASQGSAQGFRRRVEREIVIAAPRESVFRMCEDPHTMMKWVRFLNKVQWSTGSGLGSQDRCQLEVAGMKVWMGAQVHLYEKDRLIGRKSVSGMMKMQGVSLFEDAPQGTRYVWTIDYTPPFGPIGALMDRLRIRNAITKGMDESLAALKQLVESGYAPLPSMPADELKERIDSGDAPVILDVREPEYTKELGVIQGSINVPFEQLESRIGDLEPYRSREIVTVCNAGRMAGDAAELLSKKGFAQVKVLIGGMSSWNMVASKGSPQA